MFPNVSQPQCQAVAGKGWKMHRCRNRVVCVQAQTETQTETQTESSDSSPRGKQVALCDSHDKYRQHYKLERPTHCSICTEPVKPYKVRPLQCGHYFHAECLSKWVQRHNVCPMCRAPYPSVKPASNKPRRAPPIRASPDEYEHLLIDIDDLEDVEDEEEDDLSFLDNLDADAILDIGFTSNHQTASGWSWSELLTMWGVPHR